VATNFKSRDWLSRNMKAHVDILRASPDQERAKKVFKMRIYNGALELDGITLDVVDDFRDSDDWRTLEFILHSFNSESEIFFARLSPNP